MKYTNFLAFCLLISSCHSQVATTNEIAVNLQKQASKIARDTGTLSSNLEKANILLDSAILLEPRYIMAYQSKLDNLITLKRYDEAITLADAILELKPSIEIGTVKSALLYKKGKNGEARKTLSQAIAKANDEYRKKPSSNLLGNIAIAYVLNSEKEKAVEFIDNEKVKYGSKEKKQIEAIRNYLPSFTYDEILH